MSEQAPLSLRDPWVVRSVAVVAAIFVGSVILGFMVFPLVQPNAQASSLWDAICSAAGIVRAPTSEKAIEPQFTVSSAVLTSDMLRGADAESIGRGATLAHQCAICHGPTGVSRADSPNLAGQYAGVIYKELKDFQTGARVNAIMSRLPLVLGLIAVITFGLLFLLTGSVLLPLKALALNVLSLSSAFGAMVWVFQDRHLGGLGTTSTGTLVANVPVLLFCIAFGLSMDYEVFVVSRIREFWLASGRTRADNDESVALGVARTGRVVTAAALVMSISFAALIAAHVSFMRMFGVGLTLAVVVDATLVRMLLVPAFMRVLGRANWWAPGPLAWLHARIGISEAGTTPDHKPSPSDTTVTETGQRVDSRS